MNNFLSRLWKIFFFALLLLVFLIIASIVKELRANKPYIEADGYVDTVSDPTIGWVTSNKVIYSVNSKGVSDSYRGVSHKHWDDYATTKQVNFFNLITKNTEPYKNGQLLEYENGEVTIRLYDILSNRPTDNSLYKRVVLSGPLGSETQKTYTLDSYPFEPTGFDKCPNDNSVHSEHNTSIHLKPEHGCVRLPGTYSKDRRWIYYRADGQVIELMKSPEASTNWSFAHWIDWLGAYMVADSANAIGTLKILTPDGKLTLVKMGELAHLARPTRAGMVTARNSGNSESGLRVLYQGENVKIANGTVMASEVSPDGCKIAYVTNQKLRVINVCKIFGVDVETNPFSQDARVGS